MTTNGDGVLFDGTEIEVVRPVPPGFRLQHAIFDHDGTISTLREGWEGVMEPMMVRAVLGPCYEDADKALHSRVVERVREYIDSSTGIQTLVQMQELVAMVREFGCVSPSEILDEFGYKEIYNEALMDRVRVRTGKLEKGEMTADDFSIMNAVPFLYRLRDAGVTLYLASGTDEEDAQAEARIMGYADLFTGGIRGSVGDVEKEAKRMVLDRIIREAGQSALSGLATFGDGPVEVRETRRLGGLSVGVASDEICRSGLNPGKRTRLIQAGADLIIPDFSQMNWLLELLGVSRAVGPD